MSPPAKTLVDPESARAGQEPDIGHPGRAPRGAPDVSLSQTAVVGAQQTAGNRAVAAILGAPVGVQRAPADDDPIRTSGLAHGPTLDSSGGVGTAPTLPGTDRGDARRSGMAHGPTLDSSGGVGTAPTVPGGSGALPARESVPASGGSGPAAPGAPGGGLPTHTVTSGDDDDGGAPQRTRPRGPAPGLTDNSIAEVHRRNPGAVIRAINFTWYDYILDQQKFAGEEFPRGIRVGQAIVVAPDYDGPGPPRRVEPIEEPDPDGRLGPDDPVPGDPRLMQGPRQQKPDLSDPNAKRAIFPGSRRGPEAGMKQAQPVSHDEVMKAYRNNPGAVHPSKDDDWHGQVYGMDRGQGQLPRAYRSGNAIIVDPSYPLDGRPPDASPRGSLQLPGPGSDLGSVLNRVQIPTAPDKKAEMLKDPVQGPRLRDATNAQNDRDRATHMTDAKRATAARDQARQPASDPSPAKPASGADLAAQTISPTGYVPQDKKPTRWDVKAGTLSRESTSEDKIVTPGSTETTARSSKQTVNLKGAGQEWKERQETQTGDKFTAKERSTKVNLGPDGVGLNVGKATETGTTPDGPRTRTETSAGITAGPGGVGGTGSAAVTSETGTKAEAKGNVKLGKDGIEGSGTAGLTSGKGFTGHLTVSGKSHVVASDPKKLETGGFAVTFTVTDEKGVNLGGGWNKPGGGASVGLNIGSSSSLMQFETRVFDTEAQAKVFQLTAAFRVSEAEKSVAKASTAEGALAMKEGESRGTSETDTDTVGASAALQGAEVGVAKTDATTRGLVIRKVGPTKVRVTPSVSEKEALNASISAGGVLGNTKGRSEINAFAVTYEFDLGSEEGQKAFETYCKQRFPPPMPPHAKWIDSTTGHQIEDHDVYKFAHIGEIGYQDTAWQQTVVDETGVHAMAGGGKSHKVDLNWIRHVTFDDNVHSEVEIAGRMDNGKVSQLTGQMTVGGESGEYNRKQFQKIFRDKGPKPGVDVANSGEWTLSADIDAKMFEQLAQVNDDMRKAKTREEKLKIYSELAKKGSAQMLSGQVRGSGRKLAWNLELKGDPNFPGAAGREKLNEQRATLAEQLKSTPATAGAVANEATGTIAALSKRRAAVSDEKRYTDLPDELRGEQIDVINDQISQFESLRNQALSLAMRGGETESIETVRARASSPQGYKKVPANERELKQIRDAVQVKETDIAVIAREIQATHLILGRMRNARGDVKRYRDEYAEVRQSVYMEHNAKVRAALAQAVRMDERLKASAAQARDLRRQWDTGDGPEAQLIALRALDKELKNQKDIAKLELEFLQDAVREAYVITTDEAIGKDWAYFNSIKADAVARSLAMGGLEVD